MNTFNSDVLGRLDVAVDLANACADGSLSRASERPAWIFESRQYQAPAGDVEWLAVEALAVHARDLLCRIATGDHDAVAAEINDALAEQGVTPFVERRGSGWALHFHSRTASFADGWSGGIAAAIAVTFSAGDVARVGSCEARGCERLFLDRGRNQQRKFCSLRCQNRAKSATYRGRGSRSDPAATSEH